MSNLMRGETYHIMEKEHTVMNSSLSGWVVIWKNSPVQDTWSQEESTLPINLLEMRAIGLAFRRRSKEQMRASKDGQCSSIGSYKQAGRVQVLGPSQGGPEVIPLGGTAPAVSKSRTHKGPRQYAGGLAKPDENRSRGVVSFRRLFAGSGYQ